MLDGDVSDPLIDPTAGIRTVRFLVKVQEGLLGEVKIHGMLRLERSQLVLEFEKRPNAFQKLMHFLDEEKGNLLRDIPIPLTEIEDLRVQKSFWKGAAVHLRVQRMALLQGMPGAEAGAIRLPIAKADAADAEALVSRTLLLQSEERLRRQGLA